MLRLVSVDLLVAIVVGGMINVVIIFDDCNILNVPVQSWLGIFKLHNLDFSFDVIRVCSIWNNVCWCCSIHWFHAGLLDFAVTMYNFLSEIWKVLNLLFWLGWIVCVRHSARGQVSNSFSLLPGLIVMLLFYFCNHVIFSIFFYCNELINSFPIFLRMISLAC